MSALDLIQGISGQAIDLVGKVASEVWESVCQVVKHVGEYTSCFVSKLSYILGKLLGFLLSMAGLDISPSLLLVLEPSLSNCWVKAVADHPVHEEVGSLLLPVIILDLKPAVLFFLAISFCIAFFRNITVFFALFHIEETFKNSIDSSLFSIINRGGSLSNIFGPITKSSSSNIVSCKSGSGSGIIPLTLFATSLSLLGDHGNLQRLTKSLLSLHLSLGEDLLLHHW